MTTNRRQFPEVWPSSISGILSGERSCLLQPWSKANYLLPKDTSFDAATWKANHTALMEQTVERLKADGWALQVESQNFFKVKGTSCTLAGKPDIVAKKGPITRVYDCKSGAIRDEHQAQVGIYCIALPLHWNAPTLAPYIEGAVVYPQSEFLLPAGYLDKLRPRLFALLKRIGEATFPEATPSQSECRFCMVPFQLCAERWVSVEPAAPVQTTEF